MQMRLSKSIVGQDEVDAVARVILEDGYLGMGAETRHFEEDLARYLGVQPWQCISVNSGTAALHLAVQVAREQCARELDGQPEVIVPSLTFVASFQAITAAGCKPVPCDVLLETGTIDLADAGRRLSPRCIALMPVDYASNPWHLNEVYAFAARHNLRVVEDAAHAFGCCHHGRKIGSFGDLVCFSFDGIKNITCGEGGLLVAFEREAAELAADARLLGVAGDTAKRFAGARSWDADVPRQGWRYHLSNIMAAIGRCQLERLENEFIPARQRLGQIYRERLQGLADLALFSQDPEDYIVPHIMPVRILNGRKQAVVAALEKAQIPTGLHYKPNHLHSFFRASRSGLPNCERLFGELVTLPLHPGLAESDLDLICSTLEKALA